MPGPAFFNGVLNTVASKSIVSLPAPLASVIACRSDPGPLSAVLITV